MNFLICQPQLTVLNDQQIVGIARLVWNFCLHSTRRPRVASRSPLTKGPSSGSACFWPQSGMPSFLAMMHSGSTSRSAPAVSERSINDRAAARFSVLVSFTKNCPSAARNVCCGVLTINLLFSLGLPSAAKICLQRHAPKSYPSKRTQIFSIQQHSIDPKQTPSLLRSIINRQHP